MSDAQSFSYRGVRILIERDVSGTRSWSVFPNGQPVRQGCYYRTGPTGSFRGAVAEAEAAIDVGFETKNLDGVRPFLDP
ncbi:hypothetical protein [Lichenicoccus roseus]|uniref:Uncharacterized protein n=1 Tax=Lichenicoccus roseus TaxID=2683649 RepID=A0A5R9J5X2_9PROT|nr:hypothetical protein [Lichenicoccus roseus]TLU71907.1 hypothetical protein FE263_15810 [Lichenicoccus roseus]